MGMRQTPVVSRSMASSPLAGAAPHRMLSAAEVGGPPTGCSGPPGFVSCLSMMSKPKHSSSFRHVGQYALEERAKCALRECLSNS